MTVFIQPDLPPCPKCRVHPVYGVKRCECGAFEDPVHIVFCESCGDRHKAFSRDDARELWRKSHT